MAESVKKKFVDSGTTKAALQTAEMVMKPITHATITASDILLTGGLAIPAEWAVKKIVRKAKGIQEIEYNHPRWGRMKIIGQFKTLPNGMRKLQKVESVIVTKPSPYYTRIKTKLEFKRNEQKRLAELRKRMVRRHAG
jgi:hypothetical protein